MPNLSWSCPWWCRQWREGCHQPYANRLTLYKQFMRILCSLEEPCVRAWSSITLFKRKKLLYGVELWFSNRTLRLCRFKLILSEHNGSKPKLSEHNSSTEQCYVFQNQIRQFIIWPYPIMIQKRSTLFLQIPNLKVPYMYERMLHIGSASASASMNKKMTFV